MSYRRHLDVKTTKDRVAVHGLRIRVEPGMSGSIMASTFGSGSATVSGTQPGKIKITLDSGEYYPQLMGYSQPAVTPVATPTVGGLSGSSTDSDFTHLAVRVSYASASLGQYEFTFFSGSATGATPADPGVTCELAWQFVVRNTDRTE